MAQKNSNYNYLKFSNVLAANNSSGALGVADDIAYDWTDTTTDPGGNPKFVMNKSVKDKIEELATSIQDLPEIDVEEIEQYRNEAITNYQGASALSTAAQRTYANTINEINDTVQSLEVKEAEINSKVANLSSIADQLSSAFNTDAEFVVVTQDQYDTLVRNNQINDNTMYYIYSEPDVTYTVFANTNNSDLGSVAITNSNNNEVQYIHDGRGTSYTLTATAKSGAEFYNWSMVDSSGTTLAISSSSVLPITLTKDALYIANFNVIEA